MMTDEPRLQTREQMLLSQTLTPEPAQPAESPEARALTILDVFLAAYAKEPDDALVNRIADDDLLTWGNVRSILAASTARPTERGAVEEVIRHVRDALNDSEEMMNGTVVVTREHAAQLNADVDAWEADDCLTSEQAWDILLNVDDRTSPEEYPDMCLISRDELMDFMSRAALATQPATGQQTELPMDVRRLVVAARRALDADDWASTGKRDRMRTLDKAVEAFSSRVAYDDQPDEDRPATARAMGGEEVDALVKALVESESEATVRDMAGHVGDQVHETLKRSGMLMKTTGGTIAVGVMAAAQVLNDTYEFARRSLDDEGEAKEMAAAMRVLFGQSLAAALQEPRP